MPIYQLKLLGRKSIANNTIQFSFEKPENFNFIAGQYGGFTLIDPPIKDEKGITRRFSLLGSPNDEHIEIATRIQGSAFKKVLCEMPIGETIKFAGPTGKFVLPEDESIPCVLIAGGIGLAPFYSMIRQAAQEKSSRSITLLYGNQTEEDAALLNELNQLTKTNPHFKLVATLNKPGPQWDGDTGFISAEMIQRYVDDLDSSIYYVCGSPTMVTAMQELLFEMGISEEKINVEDFPGY